MLSFRKGIKISAVVAVNLVLAVISQLYVVATLGVGVDTDTYIASQAFPLFFSTIAITAIQIGWLTELSKNVDQKDKFVQLAKLANGQAIIIWCCAVGNRFNV